MSTENKPSGSRYRITKELAYLFGFVFLGLAILPLLVYVVGQGVFGEYGGFGYGEFFSSLSSRVRNGDYAALFLIFSPYLAWQTLRLAIYAWRAAGTRSQSA